jgi:DNA-binding NarL/FixJ family response regulator
MIADDQQLIRESLKIMIEDNDITVTATVANGQEVLEQQEKEHCDVILLDIRMPEMDGISCLKHLRRDFPETQVIMLTTFDDDEYIFEALKYGANGYLLKDMSTAELKKAIRTVARGGSLVTPDLMNKVIQLFADMARKAEHKKGQEALPDSIQPNERSIIRLIGQGYSNKEIAARLCLCDGTVRNYISSILQKLQVRDRTQIAIFAVQHGLNHNQGENNDR